METRKVRTPSAKLLAAKQDEFFEKVPATPIAPKPQTAQLEKSPPNPDADAEISIEDEAPPSFQSEAPPPSAPEFAPPTMREASPEEVEINVADVIEENDPNPTHEMEMTQMKSEKIDENLFLNGDFQVSNEVTISSMKYTGRMPNRKRSHFTGETLNLKSSDLSLPNKAAHFLYFRCYEMDEVQKEFPLTIDETRKGPQNFLVEPRHGLKNTDYYIDSYLWNRGKSTSSKKRIYVEVDGNHVKTSRRCCESANFVLNWYYSNMENRICKKVCWLETNPENMRASPVLVQYHVNFLSGVPIELRKTPKLYSDTRSVAQELLRSDSPMETVARFVETGETDPREIINKKQAYEMRRYAMATARKRQNVRKYDDGMYYGDEVFEEVYYDEHGEMHTRGGGGGLRDPNEASRIAQMACRMMGRKIEHRISNLIDTRLTPSAMKNQAELLNDWINTLEGTSADSADYDIAVHSVITSMRKQLEELLGAGAAGNGGFMEEGTSGGPKRMKLMTEHGEEDVDDDDEHVVVGTSNKPRYEGERYIFDGQEYVEEEVIAEELAVEEEEEVVTNEPTSSSRQRSDDVKYDDESRGAPAFFFQESNSADVSVDQ